MAAPTAPSLAEADIQQFAAALRGGLIQPGDPSYDEARAVYNGMIDKRPALIARCTDVADVIAAVNFAREQGLLVAIRGGGHNGPGLGTCDDGLVIDLSLLKGVRVDPVRRTARVEGGARWAISTTPPTPSGWRCPSGIISTTGVGGITLGGGLGHLTRQCGLAIDNLLEADVVLADGRFVTANSEEHPDLFWAVRGGGGNFGVVTSFLFRLHPIDTVYAGPMLWPLEQSAEVLRWYRDFLPEAPDELNGFFAFLAVPPAAPFPEELGTEDVRRRLVLHGTAGPGRRRCSRRSASQFGPPALDWVGPIPHPALQSMFDPLYPAGDQWYWKADFVNELPDEAIDAPRRVWRRAADLEIDDASLPDRRGGRPGAGGRDRLGLSRRQVGAGDRRGQPRPGGQPGDDRLGAGLLGGAASVFGRRRLRQHDDGRGGRGAGPGARRLRRQLRPPGADQGEVRPRQSLPRQPEHHAGDSSRLSTKRIRRVHLLKN